MSSSMYKWKKGIHKRDNYTCYYCGEKYTVELLHLDHIIPKSKGGKDKKENLITACVTCNLFKGPLSNTEFLLKVIDRYNKHKSLAKYFLKIIRRLSNG